MKRKNFRQQIAVYFSLSLEIRERGRRASLLNIRLLSLTPLLALLLPLLAWQPGPVALRSRLRPHLDHLQTAWKLLEIGLILLTYALRPSPAPQM